ncbi:cytochrome b5 [Procambarus clarkii]|uniref:cytochrome b5 n=1 Tax=Procambarus clarkii TaxID=6728 RepID=UPI001E678F02|nr:cytochrome b5-like [Procambarus clarkii]
MKETQGEVPLYMLPTKAIISFTAQAFELASQSLGYRDPCAPVDASHGLQDLKDEESGLDVFSLSQVANHDTCNDCWIILYDKVYDVTRFLLEHPGGEDVIMDYAGRDATIAFRGVGHSVPALQALDDYLVGILPGHERIYTGDGPCQWSTL